MTQRVSSMISSPNSPPFAICSVFVANTTVFDVSRCSVRKLVDVLIITNSDSPPMRIAAVVKTRLEKLRLSERNCRRFDEGDAARSFISLESPRKWIVAAVV